MASAVFFYLDVSRAKINQIWCLSTQVWMREGSEIMVKWIWEDAKSGYGLRVGAPWRPPPRPDRIAPEKGAEKAGSSDYSPHSAAIDHGPLDHYDLVNHKKSGLWSTLDRVMRWMDQFITSYAQDTVRWKLRINRPIALYFAQIHSIHNCWCTYIEYVN